MSKMSQLHAELTEQAVEYGFESIEDAEANGYEVISDGNWAKLVKSKTDEEEAHEAWLEERDMVLKRLKFVTTRSKYDRDTIDMAMEFIRRGEV